MRKITKLMLTLTLLAMGVVGAYAEKLNSNFSEISQCGTNATWDSSTKTMSWSASSYNFLAYFMFNGLTASGGYYDLSTWETITISFTLSGNSNQVRIRMKDNNGGDGDWVTMNGNGSHTINITEFKKGGSALNYSKIEGIQLSGGGDTDGAATFSELYLERPDDPLALPKTTLSNKIALAKLYNGVAYTDASFGDLTTAIADAEAALAATDATAESLTAATENVQAKIDALAFKEGYSNLTKDMMYSWSGWGADAVKGSVFGNCLYKLLESTDQPYGDPGVNAWADLSSYEKLIVVATGTPRFLLNRDADNGQWNEDETQSHLIDNTKGGWSARYFSQEGNVYTVDLAQMASDKGFAYLNAIKANPKITVSGMYLYKTPDLLQPQKDALSEKIATAKLYSSVGKTADSFTALTTALSAAEDALADANATEESLTTAATNLQNAIDGLTRVANYAKLSKDMFKQYASLDAPGEGVATGCAYETFTASDLPYGDSNVGELNWADLAGYEKLIVVTKGSIKPRFCFNRIEAGGNQADTQADSKMIDINPNNTQTWSNEAYQTIEDNVYTINLKKIVDDYGFARLHCIKKQGWGNGVIVTDMYLYNSTVYTVAGTENLTGFNWNVAENYMTLNKETGKYEKTFENITVNNSTSPEFKVVKNGTEWYPSGDNWKINTNVTGGEGNFDITITIDPTTNAIDVNCTKHLETFTATFTTNLGWEHVYAYAWTGDDYKPLGEWNEKKYELAANAGVYELSFKAESKPEEIIFHNGDGQQSGDLPFEDGKAYVWNKFTQTVTYTNVEGWQTVKAFIWTEGVKSYTQGWPGDDMTQDGDVYTYTLETYGEAIDVPGSIIFNDGDQNGGDYHQTLDLAFVADKQYTDGSYVTVTVGTAGYATYCSDRALDFSNIDYLTAYTATLTGSNISFDKVETSVPAENGLLIKGEKDKTVSAKVPFLPNGQLSAIQNALQGVLTDTHVDKGAFVLMEGEQGVGFYKTNNNAGFTVRAHSAYIPAIAGARSFIALDGETTAIDGIAAETIGNGEVYNLQGQRVVKAQKGLYIVNGKKIAIK